MPARVIYHVEPRDGGRWAAQRRGTSRAASISETKGEAISQARRLAQQHAQGQVIVHGEDGVIQREYTYGNDPARYPG